MTASQETSSAGIDAETARNRESSLVERPRVRTRQPLVAVSKSAFDQGTLVIDSGLVDSLSEPALQAVLSLPNGDTISITLSTSKDRLIMGRDRESSDLVIADPRVSRQHLALGIRDSVAYVQDLGSANGTFLNGLRVREREALYDGDVIRLGETEIGFRSDR